MSKRALRRFELVKRKKKFTDVIVNVWGYDPEEDAELIENWVQARVVDGSPCSCSGCGNPRRYFKSLTRQEKKAQESFKYALKELCTL